MKKLDGKVSVVTGGGRGIGRAIAKAQAAAGAKVAVIARSRSELETTVADIEAAGGVAMAAAADLADIAATEAAFTRIVDAYGPVDILINNAGVFFAIGPIWDIDPDVWWRDIEVNVKSAFNCMRIVLPSMIERHGGHVMNMIGGGTVGPLPVGSGYAVSKSGLMRLTECVAATLEGTGVTVLAMAPGLVRTEMTEYQLTSEVGRKHMKGIAKRFAEGDHLPPERVADLAVEVAAGRFDRLAGRALTAWDDLDTVDATIDDILDRDLRALRLTGFTPTMKPIEVG